MQARVAVVVPAFNEEASLGATLHACLQVVDAASIVVIDDGSADRTADVARQAGVRCVRLPFNLGIGAAVQTGYRWAQQREFDIAVQLDGDGQHDPEDLRRLGAPVERGECDMAIGSRYPDGAGDRSSVLRRLGTRVLSSVIRAVCGAEVRDVTSGFRAVNRRVLAEFVDYYPADYPEPESLALALLRGHRVAEVPVKMRPRQGGESSIRPVDSLIYMLKVISVLVAHATFSRPVSR